MARATRSCRKDARRWDEDVDERVWGEGCVAQATRGKPIPAGPEMPALSDI